MKATDRARLTASLRDHVAKIAADLRAKVRAPGAARVAAEQLHKDERVAEDFDVWTDLLSRRAAVLWVLKSVYVRVLEDRGLLAPGRLLDPEAQQLFEKLAPNLGETAFLRWIYRDLASKRGGVPELFSPQPAEVTLPSDDLSRALIEFWRHRDADSGGVWSFAEERFEGELMGDLYQELDPVVKERFALCQTPDFVRAFILDRTLTPAIETFGAEEVRLLDPACGSGHFLIDGLKRLVAATAGKHSDWDREKVVAHALERVVGIDLNDYACALARTRLIMTAAELAGVTKLADAARFHPHVYWADGLEQVEREEQKPSLQYALFEKVEEKPRATLTRSDVRAALRKVFATTFHAVVANPPYISEQDERRKSYHREKVGRAQRYVSAYRQYSLAAPFIERSFQLASEGGFIGLITGNNFMKREFGKPLIEKVLASKDLSLVVDTSQAFIPFHGTPTVLIFARNRRPEGHCIRAVLGRRGETGTPASPADGQVWKSIVAGYEQSGFENDFVTIADVPRSTFAKYPWSLGGGGAAQLKERIEAAGRTTLGKIVESIGRTVHTGLDDVYFFLPHTARLLAGDASVPLIKGDQVRDYAIAEGELAAFPYDPKSLEPSIERSERLALHLWRYRTPLKKRLDFGKTPEEQGLRWYEYTRFQKDRFGLPVSIVFAFVATHNQFAIERGCWLNNRHAPILKLPDGASETDHYALLGLLNSSVLGFWMRQVFHVKGGESTGKKRQSEAWSRRLEYDATKLRAAPVPQTHRERVVVLAKRLDELAIELGAQAPSRVINTWRGGELQDLVKTARARHAALRNEMVAVQEELDWTAYAAFGLVGANELVAVEDIRSIASEHRPFAIRLARAAANGNATHYWFEAMGVTPCTGLPEGEYEPTVRARIERRLTLVESNDDLSQLEAPEYKRKWEPSRFDANLRKAAFEWLSSRVEAAVAARANAVPITRIVSDVQDDARFLALASLYQNRRDVDSTALVQEIIAEEAVPTHALHTYTQSGLAKRAAWEAVWALQRVEDKGEKVDSLPDPPIFSQGSRGKSTDFLRDEYWQLRGKLDVPTERFVAFTEVPGRSAIETLYGWAGWTAQQRVKAILAIDEELEDASVALADRIGLLDTAWRLLPDVAREDAAAANRLKAELQALVGPEGPSRELIEDWKKRFPPPTSRTGRRPLEDAETEASLDNLPSVIPNVSDGEHAAILIWALLHASGGTTTRMDLARAFALRARPALMKRLAPASLKREVAHWVSTVGARAVKAGLLASTLTELVERNGVSLGTNSDSRSTVSTSPHTPTETQIDPWFHFEASLALKVLRAQPEEKFGAIDKTLKGADRKLLETAA